MNQPTDLDPLFGVYRDELLRFLIARTGDRSEAEDVLQELWLRTRQQASAPVANGRAYLYRMAQNLLIDRLRERQRRMRRERMWVEENAGRCQAGATLADSADNAEEAMLASQELDRLSDAVTALPQRAREAFVLHKLQGLSHGQVAAQLGISKSGVEKHMAVAMKYLRRAIQD